MCVSESGPTGALGRTHTHMDRDTAVSLIRLYLAAGEPLNEATELIAQLPDRRLACVVRTYTSVISEDQRCSVQSTGS